MMTVGARGSRSSRWRSAATVITAIVLVLLTRVVDAATPAPPPAASLSQTDISLVVFRNPYLVPRVSVDVTLTGSVTFAEPQPKACTSKQLWADAFIPLNDAPGFGKYGLIDSVTQTNSRLNTLSFLGNVSFWVDAQATYKFFIPSQCLANGTTVTTLDPVTFIIENGKRSQEGRVFTFLYLTAGSIALLAALGGSLVTLGPPQLVAAVVSCGCGPVEAQDEYEVLRWMLVPFELPDYYAKPDTDFTMLVFSVSLLVVIFGFEIMHFCVRFCCWGSRAYKACLARLLASSKEDTRRYTALHRTQEAAGDVDWPGRTWLPGYLLFAWTVGLSIGIMRYSMRVLNIFDNNGYLFTAFVGCFGCCFALPLLCFIVSRNRDMRYHDYQASKGRIPPWLQPSGVWGPNFFRLSFGVLFEDFRTGFKSFGCAVLLFNVAVTLPMGTTPTTLLACRNVLWIVTFAAWFFTVLLYVVRPFRSRFHNTGQVTNFGLFSLFVTFFLVRSGYYSDQPDHWSKDALFFTGMVHAAASIVVSCGHIGAAYWEAAGRLAIRNTNGDLGRISGIGQGGAGATLVQPEIQLAAERSPLGRRALELDGGTGRTRDNHGYPEVSTREMYLQMVSHFMQHPVDENEQDVINWESGVGSTEMSLAEYLLQDYEALPNHTKDEMVLAERLASQGGGSAAVSPSRRDGRATAAGGGMAAAVSLPPMVVRPQDRPQLKSAIEYEHRERPPVNHRFLL